jgi:hypothetical protein
LAESTCQKKNKKFWNPNKKVSFILMFVYCLFVLNLLSLCV